LWWWLLNLDESAISAAGWQWHWTRILLMGMNGLKEVKINGFKKKRLISFFSKKKYLKLTKKKH
jgi:hypothetical protein